LKSKINIPKSFVSFLLASFLFWLLINLSKEYITTITYDLTFEKLAQNKIFEEAPVKEIDISVKGTGFKLLSANFSKRNITFLADKLKRRIDGVNYILPREQETNIRRQLYSGLQLQKVLKDTILLHVGTLATKKVPVIANNKIDFQLGYDLVSAIKVVPDSIQVSKTEKLTIGVEKPSENEKVKISNTEVEILITVDKFTEGEFMVPFEVENLPKGITLNTFPKKIKVIFKVSLGNFNKITPTSFKVVCDYAASKGNNLTYLIPRIESKPSLVQSARLARNKIDFLIQR